MPEHRVILIIEDDCALAAAFMRLFTRVYEVILCSSLAAAKDVILSDKNIDLVISDTQLTDGLSHTLHIQVAEVLKERGITWIAMSAGFNTPPNDQARDYYALVKILMVSKRDIMSTELLKLVDEHVRRT